jgi:hypothetical protein
VNVLALAGTVAAAAILAGGSGGGALGIAALAVGALLLDVSMQSSMVANHRRVFALRADARSRLNTALMTCVFLAGGAGSWMGLRAYSGAGWAGVCALVAGLAALGLAGHVTTRGRWRTRRPRRGPGRPPAGGNAPG